MTKPLNRMSMIENALREIAAHAAAKGGEWASEQAFTMLEFIDKQPSAQMDEQGGSDGRKNP